MLRAIVLDTETSGLKPPVGVCECSMIELDIDTLDVKQVFHSLIDPEVPISPSASGIHRITDAMVREAPTLAEWFDIVLNKPFAPDDEVIFVAHNAKFDLPLVEAHIPNAKPLCTLKLARRVFPEAENHKLATLKYMFDLGTGGHSHGAATDTEDCLDLLRLIIEKTDMSLMELIEYQDSPMLITVMPFGKHKGKPMAEVPRDWVSWLMRQPGDKDPELIYSMKHFGLIKE